MKLYKTKQIVEPTEQKFGHNNYIIWRHKSTAFNSSNW